MKKYQSAKKEIKTQIEYDLEDINIVRKEKLILKIKGHEIG